MMKTLLVLLSLTIANAAFAAADDPAQKVNQVFAAFGKPGSPGCVVGVIRNGSFIYRKAFGCASLELGVPLTPESVFYMGSVSKQFTAASVVLASEQGYLSLDDDVHKYLPELPDYGHPVTLRQMLHHTSGFRDFFDLIALSGRKAAELDSAADLLKLIAQQKGLNNVPGEEWIYSNSNYFLLGQVVGRATKKSLAQFAAENIFRPLGMKHTLFYDDNTQIVPNRVAAYDGGKNGDFLVDWSTSYNIVGGGGLMSNIDDFLFWDRNFDANKLGKGTLIEQLGSPGALNNGNRINYALGLGLGKYRGLPTVEHSGANFGYRTEYLRFPKQRFSVIVLCNLSSSDPEALAHSVADLYLERDFTSDPTPHPKSALPGPENFAGTYLDPRTKTIYNFSANDGKLMGWGAVLERIDANKFYDLQGDVISFESKSGTMHASLPIPGELYFSGDRVVPMQLSASELNRFVGNFHSEELGVTYALSVDNGRLILNMNNLRVPLNAASEREFYGRSIVLVFAKNGLEKEREPDSGHRAFDFKLFTQSARGIIFSRFVESSH
ncbi:MAG TPA: serine hydrolase domain-containing protein [Terriglobales bacterium]|jgi:CubicO group peptidase (beta-lactamase class C family)|nr:serine hydrolase domain-containing protein [Terriglobales bacterium]